MIVILIIVVAAYLLFHGGHATANVRHGRRAGLRPSVYWHAGMRGPWVSVRGPFNTRIGHRL